MSVCRQGMGGFIEGKGIDQTGNFGEPKQARAPAECRIILRASRPHTHLDEHVDWCLQSTQPPVRSKELSRAAQLRAEPDGKAA